MIENCKNQENAYLTVYLSLVFAVVLSLLLALIEAAAIGAARAQADIIADLGLDSVFAEYNREILNQYELFFIDSSYGGKNGGVGMVEEHLSDYMSYNMEPSKDKFLLGESTLLKLTNPYIQIDEVSYASDENCMVWKTQAVNYMKAIYGDDIISTVKEHMDTVNANGLTTRDVISEISEKKSQFEEELIKNEIIEYGAESEEGYSYQKAEGVFDRLIGSGFLAIVLPENKSVSDAVIGNEVYFSSRMKNGRINKGIGVHEGAEKADSVLDELIYGEYLMRMYGNYMEPKANGLLKYQIEYILNGKNSDKANLKACVEALFGVRAAADIISIYNDSAKKSEVQIVATIICTLLGVPDMAEILDDILLGIWALAEAAVDVHQLLDGGMIPLMKSSDEWNVSLTEIFTGNIFNVDKKTTGMSYQDYMRVFLGLMNKNIKVERSLDIVEMDIRQTQGNQSFRIDRCIDYIEVSFGFEDTGHHSFLFNRKKCYE